MQNQINYMDLYIKSIEIYKKPLGMVGKLLGISTYVLQPGAFLAGALLFGRKSPGTTSTVFLHVSDILQRQFWTGVGYMDADKKLV